MLHCKLFTSITVLILLINYANCKETESDYYSSIYGLENLLKTEVVILGEMQNYIDAVTSQIAALESEIALIRREHLAASKDLENYLSNPVNAYRLIKRLQHDWKNLEEIVRTSDTIHTDFLESMDSNRKQLSFPTEGDVYGATVALVRLQDIYQLDVAQVASGILNSVKYGTSMSWHDCFFVGHHLYTLNEFNLTIPWLQQSMQMLAAEMNEDDALALDFMESVASYHQEMGDYETALNLTNYVLATDPQRINLNNIKLELEQLVRDGVRAGLLYETAPPANDYHQSAEYQLYKKVCREEIITTPAQQRPLRCRYHTNNVPYRLLQPFKLEELSLEPLILQFHDVIRDKQINKVKQIAKPYLSRSKVINSDGLGDHATLIRNSKSAGIQYSKHRYLDEMRLHIEDFSGLDTEQSEELQIANYGIGGQYEPHFDFFPEEIFNDTIYGNRLATGIYYLSDVAEGGGTAFPYLPLLVKPEKGSVLFWYNLHRSEDPDYRTKHAACPVLKGSKWISNIWIRVRHQDTRRPCGLTRDNEVSLPYKDT